MAGGFASLLGNSVLEQIVLYNVAGALIGAALTPYTIAIQQELLRERPLVALSPADAAEAVLRHAMDPDAAAAEAQMAGVNRDRFDVLAYLAGNAPGPDQLAEALRRELIDEGRYMTGIRQSRLRDEWAETIRRLSYRLPSPESAPAALVKGQLDEGTARDDYHKLGGDPDWFDLVHNLEGAGPSPLEAAEAARRGIIGWDGVGAGVVSFEQAVHESQYRNKWLATFRALSEYLPPPRTVTAMLREGALTREQATALFAKDGLPPELITAYVEAASHQKTAATKQLAESTVLELYRDRLITKPQATAFLESLKYTADEAGFLTAIADMQLAQRFLSSAIGHVHTLYVGHKIDRAVTIAILGRLKVDASNVSDLLAIWDYERAGNIKTLTPAEVARAMHYQIISQPQAQLELEQLGYLPHDAWVYLSQHEGGKLGGEPAPDAPGATLGQ